MLHVTSKFQSSLKSPSDLQKIKLQLLQLLYNLGCLDSVVQGQL